MNLEYLWGRAYELHANWPCNEADVYHLVSQVNECQCAREEAALLRAYLAYHFPCSSTGDVDIESELNDVLKLNPRNTTAQLYLAHNYYDNRNFARALEHFEQIDLAEYETAGQVWRSLKIQELILAAKLYLSPKSVSAQDVVDLADALRQGGVEDSVIPSELVDSLLVNKLAIEQTWTVPTLCLAVSRLRDAIDHIAGVGFLKEKTDLIVGSS